MIRVLGCFLWLWGVRDLNLNLEGLGGSGVEV